MQVLITGHSRGIGEALARHYLKAGHTVLGLSRGALVDPPAGLREARADLADGAAAVRALEALVAPGETLDLVYLNAGVLGDIANLRDTPIADIRATMDVNVWANKTLIDWLAARRPPPRQIVALSSGAAVSGNHGWGAYALSKATLNMLVRLYAHELPDTHLVALAPGLVDTAMQDALRQVDAAAFPSVERLQRARGTDAMPTPEVAAERIAACVPSLLDEPSGSFVDLRER